MGNSPGRDAIHVHHHHDAKRPSTLEVSGRGTWVELSRRMRGVHSPALVTAIDWMVLEDTSRSPLILHPDDPVLRKVWACVRLRFLSLQFCCPCAIPKSQEVLRGLGQLVKLEKLWIRHADFDALPVELKRCGKALRRVDLSGNRAMAVAPEWLTDKDVFPNLEDVNMGALSRSIADAKTLGSHSVQRAMQDRWAGGMDRAAEMRASPKRKLSRKTSSKSLEVSMAVVEVSSRGSWSELYRRLCEHDPMSVIKVDWMVLSHQPVILEDDDEVLNRLWACCGLQFVSLQFCGGAQVVGGALEGIGRLKHVQQLWLKYLEFPELPASLAQCTRLKRLDVSGNSLLQSLPEHLQERKVEVNAAGCQMLPRPAH